MITLREAAQQALEALEGGGDSWRLIGPAIDALRAALAEEALQRLTDVHQEIEAVLEQPNRAQQQRDAGHTRRPTLREMAEPVQPEQEPWVKTYSGGKPNYTQRFSFTLSCGCPSQHVGVPAYWDRDGSTAFGMICEKHWHEYGARSEA